MSMEGVEGGREDPGGTFGKWPTEVSGTRVKPGSGEKRTDSRGSEPVKSQELLSVRERKAQGRPHQSWCESHR